MQNILTEIVAEKKLEIARLYHQFPDVMAEQPVSDKRKPAFYTALENARAAGKPFFITEFKRKSPSEGWINRAAEVAPQVTAYAAAGAGAISVLTDTPFFGGAYADLETARRTLDALPPEQRPLLLQKDFILDPLQIRLARRAGADIILLIAAILEPDQLESLRHEAESLGMGVLVEVHDAEELDAIQHLGFPVLGVNNRDLKTFRTALNRVNVLAAQAGGRLLVAESGVRDYRDFQAAAVHADAFLIGTGLMRSQNGAFESAAAFFRTDKPLLLKACGIRTPGLLQADTADWLGVNFSPRSKRRPDDAGALLAAGIPDNAVAVFFQNSENDIRDTLARFPFKTVQLYGGDVSPALVRSLKQRVILAVQVRSSADLAQLEAYAPDVDFFILDGAQPGSGAVIDAVIPPDFPWPFLLAGGIHEHNAAQAARYRNCIGVDVASGIETEGRVDAVKIGRLRTVLQELSGMPFTMPG